MSKQHVVVIGAGVVGSAIAVQALRGGFKVTLIDTELPGSVFAASHGGSGILSAHAIVPAAQPGFFQKTRSFLMNPLEPFHMRPDYFLSALPWYCRRVLSSLSWERVAATAAALHPLLKESPALHARLARAAGVPSLIERGGLFAVFPSREHFAAVQPSWDIRRQAGVCWKDLETSTLCGEIPDLAPHLQYAILIEDAGYCKDPAAYTKALAQHGIDRGAAFRQTLATGIRIEAGTVRGVHTRSGEIPCDKVVVAAGISSGALARQVKDRVSLCAERGYQLDIPGVFSNLRRPVLVEEYDVAVSCTEQGLRIAGQGEIAAIDDTPDQKRADRLRFILREVFPGLPSSALDHNVRQWVGARPATPDGLPCLGYASASRDVIHAFGHGRFGLSAAARTARVVTDLLNDAPPEIDIRPYAPGRFNLY